MNVKSNLLGFKEMLSSIDKTDEIIHVPSSIIGPRHKSTGSKNAPDLIVNKRQKLPALHHTHSCTDAQLFNVLQHSMTTTSMIPMKSSEKEISRFGRLLKKIKQGHR